MADGSKIGDPLTKGIAIGPLSNRAQFEKVRCLMNQGIEEQAKLITGGLGTPDGTSKGYFVKPTVFADVQNSSKRLV